MINVKTYLLHTLTNVPVNKGPLGVQKVELVVKATPGRRDGSGVRQHAQAAGDLGQVTARDVCWCFVANTELEASGAPVDELNRALGLDDRDRGVDVLGDNIATVKESAGHCEK